MSNEPKIYANCKAGCEFETVHKEDFEKLASHIKQYPEEDGNYYLQLGKEYKIFAPKNNSNQFTCSVVFKYNKGNTETTHTFAFTNADKYADSFVFKLLDATVSGSTLTLIYEIAGVRYSETKSGSITLLEENYLYVSGADNVLMYNADASITLENVDVIDNLSSTETDKALSANQGRVLNEEISTKQNALTAGDSININDDIISLNDYELIADVTVEEPVAEVVITQASDGTPLNQYKSFMVVMIGKFVKTSTTTAVNLKYTGGSIYQVFKLITTPDELAESYVFWAKSDIVFTSEKNGLNLWLTTYPDGFAVNKQGLSDSNKSVFSDVYWSFNATETTNMYFGTHPIAPNNLAVGTTVKFFGRKK